jgi:hypothetical protein
MAFPMRPGPTGTYPRRRAWRAWRPLGGVAPSRPDPWLHPDQSSPNAECPLRKHTKPEADLWVRPTSVMLVVPT